MSNSPFDRNKTKEAKLGQLITEHGEQNQRDAIHIAVVPVIAGCDLLSGQHVSVSADGLTALHNHGDALTVGIVDPYFPPGEVIRKGQTFWLCLYQGSVHTLRHEWTHPAFPSVAAAPDTDLKAVSEVWLRAFAMRIKPYDTPENAYVSFIKEIVADEIYFHGTDTDHSVAHDPELLRHVLAVTGCRINPDDIEMRCSC